MVSMASLHFFRWTEQLKDSGLEVFWFDIRDGGEKVERINWVHQKVGWKNRWNYPGRYLLKKTMPMVYKVIQFFNERSTATEFEKYVLQVKPDVVHSFALYVAAAPIFSVMNKHKNIPWVYSSWGSDLYYFKNIPKHLAQIKVVLPRVNYLFTDCKRDYVIANQLGFEGEFLGVFPGGGGYDIEELQHYSLPFNQRKIIAIKGYQGRSGRAIEVLKAITNLKLQLEQVELVIYGADLEVIEFYLSNFKQWNNVKCIGKIPQQELLELLGKSLIHIGNSNSDGLPNTLIEAVMMGAFPIQSNPGGVTEELIEDGISGYLINDCENSFEIQQIVSKAIQNKESISNEKKINLENYNHNIIKNQVLKKYHSII